mgnify:CR=1 FL=1
MIMRKILAISVILLGSVSTITAQVKLQTNNVDEVLKAMTLFYIFFNYILIIYCF